MQENRFFVYEHLRRDTGAVFYVGKGSGYRASNASPHHRSVWWQQIVASALGFDVRYVTKDIDEELAFLIEIERIDQQRRLGASLCNLTDGGDGTSGWIKTPEWREKVGRAHRGKTISQEVRAKISQSVRAYGYVHSTEAKARMSKSRLGMLPTLGLVHSIETRQKMSNSHIGNKSRTGQVRSATERAKASAALKGKKKSILQCPYCGKTGGGGAMHLWHFDACKQRGLSCK